MPYTHLSLFSGIGGIDLAAEWAGFSSVGMVERDPYCQQMLAQNFPGVPIHDDITNFDGSTYSGVDLLTGGFPCQDISQAGHQAGLEGERSGLWFEMLRVITQARPTYVIVENVDALIRMGIDTCILGLETIGYTARPFVFPASSVGACHRRNRVFIVGYTKRQRLQGSTEVECVQELGEAWNQPLGNGTETHVHARDTTLLRRHGCCDPTSKEREGSEPIGVSSLIGDTNSERCKELHHGVTKGQGHAHSAPTSSDRARDGHNQRTRNDWRKWKVKPIFRRNDDGLPPGMDVPTVTLRLRALGNAVDPYQVYPILKVIKHHLDLEAA